MLYYILVEEDQRILYGYRLSTGASVRMGNLQNGVITLWGRTCAFPMPCRRARCCTDFSGDTRKDGSLSRFLVGGKVYTAICKGDAEEDEREMENRASS